MNNNHHRIEVRGYWPCVCERATPPTATACAAGHGWLVALEPTTRVVASVLSACDGAPLLRFVRAAAEQRLQLLAVGDSMLVCADRQAPCVLRLNGDAVAFARAVVSVALCDSAVVVVDAEGCVHRKSLSGSAAFTPLVDVGRAVRSVACGANHTLLVARDGCVLSAGVNLHGQCGVGEVSAAVDQWSEVRGVQGAVSACAGTLHSAVLTEQRELLVFGIEPFGGCEPTLAASHVAQVSAGARHLLFLDAAGSAFGWGDNGLGQLVDGGPSEIDAPTLLLRAHCSGVFAFDRVSVLHFT
jgi:hypothetical protein